MVFWFRNGCASIVALAGMLGAYSWSLWGSAAFGSLGDQAYHLELAREFDEAWRAGDFPPTWAAGANGGRGSVGFVVYPPFFAFLTACWMRLGASDVDSLRLAVLTTAGGAFGAVLYLARGWLSWTRSLLAAAMVLSLPGVTFPALARGMYPNFAALLWVALLLGAGQRILLRRSPLNVVVLVVAAAGLVLTHTLTAYLLALLFAGTFPALLKTLRWRGLATAASLAAAAAVLTCWYWLPLLGAGSYTRVVYLAASHPYLDSVLGRGVAIAGGAVDPDWTFLNDLGRYIVLAQSLLGLLLALTLRSNRTPAMPAALDKGKGDPRAPTILFVRLLPWVLGLTFLAATEPGAWLLLHLPRFELVQFSWRWQLLSALWCGIGLAALPWERKSLLPAGFGAVVLLAFSPLMLASGTRLDERRVDLPEAVSRRELDALPPLDRAAYAGNLLELRPNRIDNRYYLPAGFGRAEVLAGDAEITTRDLRTSYRAYTVTAASNTLIQVVTYHAPGWSARLDGREAELRMDCETGLQLVAIAPGTHRLELQYRAPWPWQQTRPRESGSPRAWRALGKSRYCCPCPGGT